jgi:predicted O-methyltransferase YrrM
MYLLAALRDNLRQEKSSNSGTSTMDPCVFGTEQELEKANIAVEHIQQGFEDDGEAEDIMRKGQFRLLQGDLLEEIPRQNFKSASLDALLLDIWAPVALPTLRLLEPALRPGALMLIDNTITGRERYKDLLTYINDPAKGWQSQTLPFSGGFDLAIKQG